MSKKPVKEAAKAAPAAPAKAKREKKDRGPKDFFLPLETRGTSNISQSVQHLRSTGVLLVTKFHNDKGDVVGGSTIFIPGIKPKSKKGERFLVQDKGPKPKKEKKAKKA
jgi:hypothetical protein